jgi:hypothetical protein
MNSLDAPSPHSPPVDGDSCPALRRDGIAASHPLQKGDCGGDREFGYEAVIRTSLRGHCEEDDGGGGGGGGSGGVDAPGSRATVPSPVVQANTAGVPGGRGATGARARARAVLRPLP